MVQCSELVQYTVEYCNTVLYSLFVYEYSDCCHYIAVLLLYRCITRSKMASLTSLTLSGAIKDMYDAHNYTSTK